MPLKEYTTLTNNIKWLQKVTQNTLVYIGKLLILETIEGQIFTHPDNTIIYGPPLEITNEIERLDLKPIDPITKTL